jgi:hypothetical protein
MVTQDCYVYRPDKKVTKLKDVVALRKRKILNKTESFAVVEPLHFSLCHFSLLAWLDVNPGL